MVYNQLIVQQSYNLQEPTNVLPRRQTTQEIDYTHVYRGPDHEKDLQFIFKDIINRKSLIVATCRSQLLQIRLLSFNSGLFFYSHVYSHTVNRNKMVIETVIHGVTYKCNYSERIPKSFSSFQRKSRQITKQTTTLNYYEINIFH